MIAAEDEAKGRVQTETMAQPGNRAAPDESEQPARAEPSPARAGLFGRWEGVLLLLLVAVCVGNTWASPYFLDAQNLLDSTQSFSEKALIALGMTLVIIGRDIDLSVAAIVALCGTAIGWLASQGVGTAGLLVASVACGTALGMFNGVLVARLGLPSIVVTIGTVSLFRGISFVALGDGAYTVFPDGFDALGQGYLLGVIPYELLVLVVFAAAFYALLHHTRVGRRLYAYGQNPDAARYSGIAVEAHRFWFFTLNGSMSGLAAALLTSRIGAARPNMASGWDLEVIAIVVLGGVGIGGGSGRMSGVILAVFVMGLLTFGLGLCNVPGITLNIIVGALLVASVALPAVSKKVASHRVMAPARKRKIA